MNPGLSTSAIGSSRAGCAQHANLLYTQYVIFLFAGESRASLLGRKESCLMCLCLNPPPFPPSKREFPFSSWDLQPTCILPAKKEVHILNRLWPENVASAILLSW